MARLSDLLPMYVDDEWKSALAAMCALLDQLQESGTDPGPALDELGALPPQQHAMIVRHLDLVLTGGMKDRLWAETRQAAEQDRFDNDRLNRAWAYFQPNPAGPRARVPADDTTLGDWLRSPSHYRTRSAGRLTLRWCPARLAHLLVPAIGDTGPARGRRP